jgi:hypothetical protein
MPGPSLYFPDGIPPNVQRLVDPDEIHRLVQAALKKEAGRWEKLSPLAENIADGDRPWYRRIFGGRSNVPPNWLVSSLYRDPKKWPGGLSARHKKLLLLLRRVRDLSFPAARFTYTSLAEAEAGSAPSEDDLLQAFKLMAKDTKKDILAPMWRGYNAMLARVGGEIEPLCIAIYGEACEKGDGAGIANADIRDAVKVNRLPLTPAQTRTLETFLLVYGT